LGEITVSIARTTPHDAGVPSGGRRARGSVATDFDMTRRAAGSWVLGVRHKEYGGVRRPTRALALVAAGLAALGSVAACGGDDDGGDASAVEDLDTTTTEDGGGESTTSTTQSDSPEAQAIAAYEAAWAAMFTASDPPNPMHPDLSATLTGVARDSIVAVVVEQQNAGQRTAGSMETHPEAVSVTGSEVRLRDCTVEQSTTYDIASGAVVEGPSGTPRAREVEVVNQDGTWRVSVITTLEDPCTPSAG
jgi:hypothetical protein